MSLFYCYPCMAGIRVCRHNMYILSVFCCTVFTSPHTTYIHKIDKLEMFHPVLWHSQLEVVQNVELWFVKESSNKNYFLSIFNFHVHIFCNWHFCDYKEGSFVKRFPHIASMSTPSHWHYYEPNKLILN